MKIVVEIMRRLEVINCRASCNLWLNFYARCRRFPAARRNVNVNGRFAACLTLRPQGTEESIFRALTTVCLRVEFTV